MGIPRAFLSYSHHDLGVARAFEPGLQRIACPWLRVRAIEVFRDESNLRAAGDLPEAIKEAMGAAEHLVVLASLRSAASRWVCDEVGWWFENKTDCPVYLVLIDGAIVWEYSARRLDPERTTAIAPALHHLFRTEPIYADLTQIGQGKLSYRKAGAFRTAVVKIAAAIRKTDPEVLDGQDERARRRRVQVAAGLLLATLGAAGWSYRSSTIARTLAYAREAEAMIETDPAFGLARADMALDECPSALQRTGLARWACAMDDAERAFRSLVAASRTQRRLPHLQTVRHASFDRRGDLVVTVSGASAQVWDATTGAPLGTPIVADANMNAAVFTGDGHMLTASLDPATQLWGLRDAQWTREEPIAADTIVRDVVSDGEAQLAMAAANGDVQIWRHVNGTWSLFRTLAHRDEHGSRIDVSSAAFSSSGRRLVTTSVTTARVWDVVTGKEVAPRLEHACALTDAAFDPTDERRVVTATWASAVADGLAKCGPRAVQVWTLGTHEPEALEHPDGALAVAFDPAGELLATTSPDGIVRIWDARRRVVVAELRGHRGRVKDVQFSPDGERVLTAGDDGTARIWRTRSISRTEERPLAHDAAVYAATLSPRGNLLAIGTGGREVRVWDIGLRRVLQEFAEEDSIHAIAFIDEGRSLLVATTAGTLHLHAVDAGSPGAASPPPVNVGAFLDAIDVRRDGRVLAVTKGAVQVWDAHRSDGVGTAVRFARPVVGAALGGDGSRVVTASGSALEVWDAASGGRVGEPMVESEPIAHVAFSCDRDAVVVGAGNAARVWTVSTRTAGPALSLHGPVTRLAISCDGNVGAAVSEATVQLWQAADGRSLGQLTADAAVFALAFSADGRLLTTGDAHGGVTVWDVETGSVSARLVEGSRNAAETVVESVAFGAYDALLVTTARDNVVRVFSRDRFEPLPELRERVRRERPPPAVSDGSARVARAEAP